MRIIENVTGWEDEEGIQIALKEEFAFFNTCMKEEIKLPIWKKGTVNHS